MRITCQLESLPEILERLVGNLDLKRFDISHGYWEWSSEFEAEQDAW